MIIFEWIRWKNLLSTGNAFTEIQLNKSSNTLVVGYNGSGKSTLLDALCFVLFGVAFREINKPQLVNSVNGKDLVVEVAFTIGLKRYRVARGIKPTVFEIYVDGVLLDQNAVPKDYQLYLEENILGSNKESFKQIVILGNSSFVSFMKLTAAERRAIIEDLLDIQIFSAMNKVVKDKVSVIKNKDSEIRREIESVKAQIELQQKHVKDSESNVQEQIDKLKQAKEENLNKREKTFQRLNDPEGLKYYSDILKNQTNINKKAFEKKINQLNIFEVKITANLNAQIAEVGFYEVNDICPTCIQSINNEFKKQTLVKKKAKIEEYRIALVELDIEKNRIEEVKKTHKELEKKFAVVIEMILAAESELRWIDNAIVSIDRDILELSQRKPLSDDMLEISKGLIQKLTNLTEDQKKNQNEKLYYDASAILLKDNGIKAKIVNQYLPVINKLVNKYLTAMDFFVNFEIDSEFKETIKSRYRDIFSYSNFSDGEKKRIDLALIFTWREMARLKNSMSTNLLIMDEIMDGALDNFGIEEVMKLIHSFGKDVNIFVISPKQDILVDKFNGLIRFEKKGNFSRMVA